MDFLMLVGIETIMSQLSGMMMTFFALGPLALPLLLSFIHELSREMALLGFQSIQQLNQGLKKLKKLNHKAYLELLKLFIALQQQQQLLTKPIKHKAHAKRKVKVPSGKKVAKLLKKITKMPKKAIKAYKTAKVHKLKTAGKGKNYVLAKSIKTGGAKAKKAAAYKPGNHHALKAAFKEIGKKEYTKELKGSHKSAAIKPSH